MQTRNQIEDGYTRAAYIEPVRGLHQGLAFEYRPMLPEEFEDMFAALDKTKRGRETVAAVADRIAVKITRWSEVDRKSAQPIKVSASAYSRFGVELFRRVRGIVQGTEACDLPPGIDDEGLAEFVKAKIAEAHGEPPGGAQLATDQKN